MQSVSLFEQLTRNVPVPIVSGAVLAVILISTIACRVFFFSTKSKQQHSKNEKKSTTKKQSNEATASNKKKTTKAKKNVAPVSSSSSSPSESEEEKATLVSQTKKATPPNQVTKDTKKKPTNNADVQEKSGDNKKKQTKPITTANDKTTHNKQVTSGNATNKVNSTVSNKKQPVMTTSTEIKQTPTVDRENGSDQEDDGQWVTQSTKQVNNRNRNKGKTETSPSALAKNSSTVSEKRKVESDFEPAVQPTSVPEPIEVCQLIPKNENLYTASDNWWKQALNQQQTFSVNDIGEWPERDQDEQYTVQVKRIVPIQNRNDA